MKTYFVDANVFLRFLIGDVPRFKDEAQTYFAKARAAEIKLVLTAPIFFELVFVMNKEYRMNKDEVVKNVGQILNIPYLQIEEEGILKNTLVSWAHKNIDLVDCYLLEKAAAAGGSVLTFDKKLAAARKVS